MLDINPHNEDKLKLNSGEIKRKKTKDNLTKIP